MNHAIVALDESGSMAGQETRVVTSMNEYVGALPKKKTRLAVFKFDSVRWTEHYNGKVKDWTPMETKDYRPGAMTPLYDSIAKAIEFASKNSGKDDKVMVMIDTDGMENASTDHDQDSIKKKVKAKKKKGWDFKFMASGIDDMAAAKIGKTGTLLGLRTTASSHKHRVRSYLGAAAETTAYFNGEDIDPANPSKKKKKAKVDDVPAK